jgi:hypothetical protein
MKSLRQIQQEIQDNPYMFVPLSEAEKERLRRIEESESVIKEIRSLNYINSIKYLHYDLILKGIPEYKMTDDHRLLLRRFTKWIWSIPDESYDLKKGFLVIGIPGTGKTTIMEYISLWSSLINKRPFKMCYAKKECDHAFESKATQLPNQFFKGNLCIDEVGHEKNFGKVWGKEVSYIGDLIESRYDTRHLYLTHATTNIPIKEDKPFKLSDIYDKRIISRMHEMFNIFYLNGTDWRQVKK